MGYTTEFCGTIAVTPALPLEFIERWNKATEGTPGKRYVSSYRDGVSDEPDMLPGFPGRKPRAWCQWVLVANQDDAYTGIEWDGNEKFYDYINWLQFLVAAIRNVEPDAEFEGFIEWDGEEHGDIGALRVNADGQVEVGYPPVLSDYTWREV